LKRKVICGWEKLRKKKTRQQREAERSQQKYQKSLAKKQAPLKGCPTKEVRAVARDVLNQKKEEKNIEGKFWVDGAEGIEKLH